MRICITATGPDLDSTIDPRFGRCNYFVILNEKGELIKSIKNQAATTMRGAGVQAAQIISDNNVSVLITGQIGPHAYETLQTAGIEIMTSPFGLTAQEAFNLYQNGQLNKVRKIPGQYRWGWNRNNNQEFLNKGRRGQGWR